MKSVFKVLLLAMASQTVYANEALLRCRAITEAAPRLACYDALPIAATAPAPATASKAIPVPSNPAEAAAWAQAQSQAQAKGVPLFVQETSSQFGMDKAAAAAKLDALESSIEGRFEGWDAKTKIQLANGQIWQITDGSRGVLNLMNPKVKIRRGMFSAYYLELDGSNLSPRVKRVK